MSDIKVTAIITVYNEKELVKRSIDSLLTQTLSEIEVLIIDDGSSDGTPEVIESLPDSRIRLIRGKSHGESRCAQTGL